MVTMVWIVSRSKLKATSGTSSPYISPLTPSGQRNCASWTSQPQKSVTLPPQPGVGTTKVRMNMWWHYKKKYLDQHFKTWCTTSFLFSTKCRVFHNFILFYFIQYSRFT